MPNPEAQLEYIEILAGVTPPTDDTLFSAQNYTSSLGIRFRNGKPEKKGGYQIVQLNNGATINGVPRSIYSTEINGVDYDLIGTNTRLYVLINSTLTNITPFSLTPVPAPASLTTDFATLAANPISTISGSSTVTVADASAVRRQIGDVVTLSGASAAVGGITTTQINAAQVVRSVTATSWTFMASTNATSTAMGGGSSVKAASGLVNMTIANSLGNGDRVKIAGAANNPGGITNTQINQEFIIRNVTTSGFDFLTAGTATSHSVNGDGTGTEYYPPIPIGNSDESYGLGYGQGKYGVGTYGTSKTSGNSRTFPRIWFFDRFGDFVMITPGNQGALYEWSGNTLTAPTITLNSPSNINYMFVADNTIVVFGNGGTENRITACDQGNRTVWTGTAQNQFFDAVESGAARFIGALKLNGISLIFTEQQVYTFQQIGLPNIWQIDKLADVGMISPMGGCEVNGTAYWQGLANFYTWSGGTVSVMPSNLFPVTTILKYTFNNINFGQKSKSFVWFNKQFQELRFHYPSASSNDPDSVAAVNLMDNSWWPDQETRTAAESPATLEQFPRLIDNGGILYQHERGTDNVNVPLPFALSSNLRTLSKNETLLSAFIPDSIQTGGAIQVEIIASQWPNSLTNRSDKTYPVAIGGGRQPFGQQGRFWQYLISGSVLGQSWRMGQWAEERQMAGDGA